MPIAYIDDSGRDDHSPVLVLAGFAAPAKTWLSFSEDWQRALEIDPKIKYFRAYEAAHRVEEFVHFSEARRDRRVKLFCDVLDKYAPIQLSCVVVLDDFDRVIKSPTLPKWAHNPYYFAFWTIVSGVGQHQRNFGFSDPMNFIFDEQAERKRIEEAWDDFVENAPADIVPFIGIEPAFLSDEIIKPLQAANLMAWHTRDCDTEKILKNHTGDKLPWVEAVYSGIRIVLDEGHLRVLLAPWVKSA